MKSILPLAIAVFLLAGSAATSRAATGSPGENTVIQLPPFVVKGQNPWLYAEVPGMTVLSLENQRATQQIVEEFQRARRFMPLFFPPGTNLAFAAPSTLILNPYASKRVISDLGEVAKVPPMNIVGMSVGQDGFVYDFTTAAAIGGLMDRSIARAMGFKGPTYNINPPIPVWYVEGLTTLIGEGKMSDTEIEFSPNLSASIENKYGNILNPTRLLGKLDPMPLLQEINRINPVSWIMHAALDPMTKRTTASNILAVDDIVSTRTQEQLLARMRASGQFQRRFMRSAALFVYWGFFSDGGSHRAPFIEFASSGGASDDATLQRRFGLTAAAIRDAMLPLAATDVKGVGKLSLPSELAAKPLPPVVLRPAKAAEVGRVSGDIYLALAQETAGSGPASSFYRSEARKALVTLVSTYDGGERSPAFQAVLGYYEYGEGNLAQAREHLDAAASGGVANQYSLYLQAMLRLDDAGAKLGDGKTLAPAELDRVLEPLHASLKMVPRLPEAYRLLADLRVRGADRAPADDLSLLARGFAECFSEFAEFPVNQQNALDSAAAFLVDATRIDVRNGQTDLARRMVARGLSLPGIANSPQKAALLDLERELEMAVTAAH